MGRSRANAPRTREIAAFAGKRNKFVTRRGARNFEDSKNKPSFFRKFIRP
jgi:hypothetical protein